MRGWREQKRGGPGERVVDEEAEQTDRGALRPARVDEIGAAGGGLREKVLKIGGGLRVGELRFVEFDVVAVFEGGEEFDAVERRQVFERAGGGRR